MAIRSRVPCSFWCLDPFPLCQVFPDALGGRDAVEYYGSAVPAEALATCPPTLGSPSRFRRCSHSNCSVNWRCPSVTLAPGEPGREARLVDTWSSRRPQTPNWRLRSRSALRFCPAWLPPPLRHSLGRVRRALPRIAHPWVVPYFRHGYSGLPMTGSPALTAATFASWRCDSASRLACVPLKLFSCPSEVTVPQTSEGSGQGSHACPDSVTLLCSAA